MPRTPGGKVDTRHTERLCIVMACADVAEAAEIGQHISQVHKGTLVTYRRADDIMSNPPAGRVVLIILAADDDPKAIAKTLNWMRHRWPRCPIAVIGNTGGGAIEIAARMGGANYLTRPVNPAEWEALVQHVLTKHGQIVSEVGLG